MTATLIYRFRQASLCLFILIGLIILFSGCRTAETSSSGRITVPEVTINGVLEDLDRDGLSDAFEDGLMGQFAPVVRFHPDEKYFPANISWYLERVRLRFDVELGFDKAFLGLSQVDNSRLISQRYKDQFSGLSAVPTDFFLEQTDANGGDGLDDYRLATRVGTVASGWTCYARIRPVSSGSCDIQYIFFYAYNGDLLTGTLDSAHEADMEHITVRLNNNYSSVEKIYYAAHDGEGKWYLPSTPGDLLLTSDGRPVVYSALDSHASYPAAGEIDRGYLPSDRTSEGGFSWDCQFGLVNLGEKDYPRPGQEWLQYSGRWGEIGEVGFTKGPYGPAYQSWWDGDPG